MLLEKNVSTEIQQLVHSLACLQSQGEKMIWDLMM